MTMPTPPSTTPAKPKSPLLPVILGLSGLVVCICCICPLMFSAGQQAGIFPTSEPTSVAQISPSETPGVISTSEPTAISLPAEPASTDTPLPAATQDMGHVGERREVGGIALTVVDVSKTDKISFSTAEDGNTYLVLEVLIENVSNDEDIPYNPLYFSVKDADGFQYTTSFVSPDPSLKSGELAKGEKARGFISFEIKSTATGLVVTYKPLVLFSGYEPIKISLDQ